tara:strand:+ start:710 stop:1192 length:483 start_codon:yes stop_codon:yes gene_type:complete
MNLYILHQDKCFFSVYIDNKTIVISSTDRAKLREFKKVVEHHHRVSGRWLNTSRSYSLTRSPSLRETQHELQLGEGGIWYSQLMKPVWDMVEMDMYNASDSNLVDLMYECANIRLFLMKDFELCPEIPLLCINGVLLEKPSEVPRYDPVIFLDALRNLDN